MRRYLITASAPIIAFVLMMACSSSDSGMGENANVANQSDSRTTVAREPRTFQPPPGALGGFDLNGQWHNVSDWIGRRPVVINFWGTWCAPCRREIPGLIKLYEEYRGRGVEIVSLAIERRAGPAQVRQFTQQAGMKWVQLMANEDIARNLRLTGSVPTTIFFDATGQEVARHVGARPYDVLKIDFEKIAVGS